MASATRAAARKRDEIRTEARAAADEVQRRLISTAACRVIAAEGLEAASLRRIAEELGCTTGLIGHYFSSKEELLIQVLDRSTERMRQLVAERLGRGESTDVDQLLDAFCTALPVDEERLQYWRVLTAFRTAAASNDRLRAFFDQYGAEQARRTRLAFAAATGRPIDDPVVDELEAALSALLDGIGLCASEQPERYRPERVRELLRATVGHWIADSGPRGS